MPQVRVDLQNTDEGEKVEVLYLGRFANGQTHDLSDVQVQTWEAQTGRPFPEDGLLVANETALDPAPSGEDSTPEPPPSMPSDSFPQETYDQESQTQAPPPSTEPTVTPTTSPQPDGTIITGSDF